LFAAVKIVAFLSQCVQESSTSQHALVQCTQIYRSTIFFKRITRYAVGSQDNDGPEDSSDLDDSDDFEDEPRSKGSNREPVSKKLSKKELRQRADKFARDNAGLKQAMAHLLQARNTDKGTGQGTVGPGGSVCSSLAIDIP
jgi:hypothetical protein